MGEEWLLKMEEIDKIMDTDAGWCQPSKTARKVAQAQLRKVAEWGEGPCLHSAEFEGMNLVELPTPQYRHLCPKCWAELCQEVGL